MRLAAVACLVLSLIATGVAQEPPTLRVGVVAYQDFRGESDHYTRLVRELATAGELKFEAQLAFGTYGDVLYWLDAGHVDVAVLTPGLYSQALRDSASRVRYLATMGLPPAAGKLATAERKQPGYHMQCRACCVVAADSQVKTVEEMKRLAQAGQVRWVFVHPVSVAGRIAPEFALEKAGVHVVREHVLYTNSHTGSLRVVAQADGTSRVEDVAFVWDDADRDLTEADGLRKLDFPALDALSIPQSAVVARADYPHAEELQRRLLAHRDAGGEADFVQIEDPQKFYAEIDTWSDALGVPPNIRDLQNVSLSEIGQTLLHHARSQPRPPRLAVVLSGGGAKCSFQVGAVRALEEELARLRRDNPEQGLDIALVVGTSGGAINALPIALGSTSTPEGQQTFEQVWQELDQRQIVRPSFRIRWNIGIWAALAQTALILAIVRKFVDRPRRPWVFAWLFVAFGGVEVVLGYLQLSPWSLLGQNHLVHHAWLWITFGIRASAWWLLGFGLISLAAQTWLVRRDRFVYAPQWVVKWLLAAGLLGLPLLQVLCVLFYEQTLSSSTGIESALAEKFPRLIDAELTQRKKPPLKLDATTPAERLRATSRQVVDRRLLKRDMVLTGSCLEQTHEDLPSDLYFYLAAQADAAAPQYGNRGVSLADHDEILLDVVMGSGSIFPVFPPRAIDGFPRAGERIELVDGGFAHNSPLEAAVLWGATHIVLFEASPEARLERDNFLGNSVAAFEHLYQQAQLLDAHSRGHVVVFSLSPLPPHLCVIDFADNLIAESIAKGYRQAGGERDSAPAYRKELGQPQFVEVTP